MSIGGESKTEGTDEKGTKSGTGTERLKLDDKATAKIIEDVLGSQEGLASVFGGEQNAGIFNSSVAAQASGNLVTNLIGELAKLTAEKETTFDEKFNSKARTTDHRFFANYGLGNGA